MAPAVLPWPALRSLLDAVGFAIAVSVAKPKVQTMYRGPREVLVSSAGGKKGGSYCLVWGHPSHQFGPKQKQALWKLKGSHQERHTEEEDRRSHCAAKDVH